MALIRKVPLKKLDPPVKTFYGFAIALTSMVTKAGHNCEEIRGERNGIPDVVISPKHRIF